MLSTEPLTIRGIMADIDVSTAGGDEYVVEVREGGSSTRHTVTLDGAALERFGGGAPAERLLEESFRFLLEREPKEAILRRFEISVIGRYFPEFESEIRGRVGAS
ncbi:MAG: hypothetical protein V3W24_04655 [Gemmatimonadota bacterium]